MLVADYMYVNIFIILIYLYITLEIKNSQQTTTNVSLDFVRRINKDGKIIINQQNNEPVAATVGIGIKHQ